jgi:hypothetical protein
MLIATVLTPDGQGTLLKIYVDTNSKVMALVMVPSKKQFIVYAIDQLTWEGWITQGQTDL